MLTRDFFSDNRNSSRWLVRNSRRGFAGQKREAIICRRGDAQPVPSPWNQYVVADARNLSAILGNSPVVDVTITSPPYWDMKNYEVPNQIGYGQCLDAYLSDLVSVFRAIWHCTKDDGSLWVVIKSVKKDGKLHLLPFLLSQRLTTHKENPWNLQDILIWHKTHTLPWSHRQKLTDNYECILCFSKSRQFSLNLDAVRSPNGICNWWVKYPERYHPLGKAFSNVWEIPIPTQGSWGNGHFAHACPMPIELIRRIILLASPKSGLILDPFAGTGSTALAAEALGRKWMMLDINPDYRNMFIGRLANEATGTNGDGAKAPQLAAANLALRQLKYGLLIYKRIAPSLRLSTEDVPLICVMSGHVQRSARPYWVKGTKVTLVLSDKCHHARSCEIVQAISEHCGKPPLSKFQIEVAPEAVARSRFLRQNPFVGRKRLCLYPRGEFWQCAEEIDFKELSSRMKVTGKLPVIASDLHICEHPAY